MRTLSFSFFESCVNCAFTIIKLLINIIFVRRCALGQKLNIVVGFFILRLVCINRSIFAFTPRLATLLTLSRNLSISGLLTTITFSWHSSVLSGIFLVSNCIINKPRSRPGLHVGATGTRGWLVSDLSCISLGQKLGFTFFLFHCIFI